MWKNERYVYISSIDFFRQAKTVKTESNGYNSGKQKILDLDLGGSE